MTLLAAGILQRLGSLIVAAIVLAFAAFGAGAGVFVAVLVGIDALASLVVSLAFAKPLAALLVGMEIPENFAFAAAFGILLVGTATAIRMAIGRWVPPDVVRFAPLVDQLGGGMIGAVAGMVVAGAVLIAASILPLPEWLAVDGTKLQFDMGTRLLRTFARCVEPRPEPRSLLLEGEPPARETTGLLCSELFADTNGNGSYDADGTVKERYVDADRNGMFTRQLPFADGNSNGRRDVGLLDRYRVGSWERAAVMHSPALLTSPDSATVADDAEDGAAVYQAVATDLDPGDTLVFGILPAAVANDGPAGGGTVVAAAVVPVDPATGVAKRADMPANIVGIDPMTGVVKLVDAAAFAREKSPYRFVLTVTDRHGLTCEKTVSLHRSPVKPVPPRKRKAQDSVDEPAGGRAAGADPAP